MDGGECDVYNIKLASVMKELRAPHRALYS